MATELSTDYCCHLLALVTSPSGKSEVGTPMSAHPLED